MMLNITGFVTIRNKTAWLDGSPAAQAEGSSSLDQFLQQLYESGNTGYTKFYKMDRLSASGFLAAELLFQKYPLNEKASAERAIVLSNANGSTDVDRRYAHASKTAPSPALFVYTLPNIVAGEICIRQNIKGENAFFISEKFDADLLVNYVDQVFLKSQTKSCLAGWIEVLEEQHDVFLYLVESEARGVCLPHSPEQVNKLYHHS